MYEAAQLNQLLATCKQYHLICIADEVMTGFGRTGKNFASEYMEVLPDIICLSKGLTGGTMALGVTAAAPFIVTAFDTEDKLKTFFHGHSFTANPLACTAANASLDLLEQPACKQAINAIVQQNKEWVSQLHTYNLPIKNIRQLGTIVAFEIDKGKTEYLNSIAATITKKGLEKGIYIRPLGNTVYIMPPYCIDIDTLKNLQQTIAEIITAC
jgi:adenosylmethionine---8-amino-7-oxononanoate aminotransferase